MSMLPPPQVPPPGGGRPPFPPAYQPTPYQQPPQGTSGMAVASLICSLAGILMCGVPAVLGVIFGRIALRQTRDNARPGRGLAMAGTIVGVVVVVVWTALWIAVAVSDNHCVYIGTKPAGC